MAAAKCNDRPLPTQGPEPNPPTAIRIYRGDAIVSLAEMVQCLLWDLAKRAQQDEERAYQQYRRFISASEEVMVAHQERRRAQ